MIVDNKIDIMRRLRTMYNFGIFTALLLIKSAIQC